MATTRESDGWHLDKKVPVSIIVVLVVQIVTFIFFLANLNSRVGMIEKIHDDSRVVQHERDDRQDRDTAEAFTLIRQQLSNMDGKLDRLIERPKN